MAESGFVRDIRTGRAIGRTNSITGAFVDHVKFLVEEEQDFYIVFGRCRHADMRKAAHEMRDMGLKVIYDKQMPSDTMWIFAGDPAELGFAS